MEKGNEKNGGKFLLGEAYMSRSLYNTPVSRGEFKKYIDSLTDPDIRRMVRAEYCYFTGNHDEAAEILSEYVEHEDHIIRLTAWFMYIFCNLTLCRTEETQRGIGHIYKFIKSENKTIENPQMQAFSVFVSNAANILLDLQIKGIPSLEDYVKYLPDGFRVFSCYLLSMQAYLRGDYAKGLGIVDTCLSFEGTDYVIPSIYLCLGGAMNAMSLEDVKLGKMYFNKAYELAKEDELFEALGENHGLLQGLIETCLKNEDKDNYERIIDITYKFSYGWRRIHNPLTKEDVADTLSTTEFTIAMLANRGWTNNEIAEYMGLNINTVKTHITNVFNKLNIKSRKELKSFMLK